MRRLVRKTTAKMVNRYFDNAIKKGLLSHDEKKENFVGGYMYMYSKDNRDFFKHHLTREYVNCQK